VIPKGHLMTLHDSLHHVSKNITFKFLIPWWGENLTAKTRLVTKAYRELGVRLYLIVCVCGCVVDKFINIFDLGLYE